jgi:hypothetical protein
MLYMIHPAGIFLATGASASLVFKTYYALAEMREYSLTFPDTVSISLTRSISSPCIYTGHVGSPANFPTEVPDSRVNTGNTLTQHLSLTECAQTFIEF